MFEQENNFFEENIENKKDGSFSAASLIWISIAVLSFFGLGIFGFIPPLIIYGIISPYQRTDLFKHHYYNSFNYIFTSWIWSIGFVVLMFLGLALFFVLGLEGEMALVLWLIFVCVLLLIYCVATIYYFVMSIIAAVKAYNHEFFNIPLVIKFFK